MKKRMLMYVLALSDFKLLACLWAANAGTFYTFFFCSRQGAKSRGLQARAPSGR